MFKKSILRTIAVSVVSFLLITSCSPSTTPAIQSTETTQPNRGSTSTENPQGPDATLPQSPTLGSPASTATALPNQPTPTPIIETRLPPEQWQAWPVVPELTGRETAIYQHGQILGNDPTHFSKVGDCQAIKDVLMGIYDKPDRYYLTESDSYLQEAIDTFSGSFDRDGQAVRGGYNAAAVLSPVWADPEACQPGETPIACEYRIHKPSFVIISLEVWWEGRTEERYEAYMRQIIDFYIENGVVPILSTKADNVEGDHRINLATAKLAYEYHIPLWNFWRAVQPLPNHGIDPERDGFHISYEAWTVRSYTALQALDAVWRGVRDLPSTDNDIVETQQPQETQTTGVVNLSPQPVNTPLQPETEKLYFSFIQRVDDQAINQGIFAYDLQNQTLHQIFDAGYTLEDVTSDGTAMLVSKDNQLFLTDSNGAVIENITEKFAVSDRNASAYFLPDGSQILFITQEDKNNVLWIGEPTERVYQRLAEGNITGIIKPYDNHNVFWYEGECDQDLNCDNVVVWLTQDGQSNPFSEENNISFSPSGERYAWVETTQENNLILYHRLLVESTQDFIYLPGNRLIDLSWSPFSDRMVILTVTRSDYTGKSSDTRIFSVEPNSLNQVEYLAYPGLNSNLAWHRDGSAVLLASTLLDDEGYQFNINRLNLETGGFTSLNQELSIESENFIAVTKMYWVVP